MFPFDPAEEWGERARHFVGGRLNGFPFKGEIGFRRRVFYTLLDEVLLGITGVSAGDRVEVIVGPRQPSVEDLNSPANLVWSRIDLDARPPRAKKRSTAKRITGKTRFSAP